MYVGEGGGIDRKALAIVMVSGARTLAGLPGKSLLGKDAAAHSMKALTVGGNLILGVFLYWMHLHAFLAVLSFCRPKCAKHTKLSGPLRGKGPDTSRWRHPPTPHAHSAPRLSPLSHAQPAAIPPHHVLSACFDSLAPLPPLADGQVHNRRPSPTNSPRISV